MRYLDYYKKWIANGEMDSYGLCATDVGRRALFKRYFMNPRGQIWHPVSGLRVPYWGYDGRATHIHYPKRVAFSPLRQNIVLLLAAMNGEL